MTREPYIRADRLFLMRKGIWKCPSCDAEFLKLKHCPQCGRLTPAAIKRD